MKKKFLYALVPLLCILSTHAQTTKPSTSSNQTTPEEVTYKQLKDLYNSGNQDQAILEAQTYLKKYPNDTDVRLALGEFYFSQKKYDKARIELIQGLQQMPDYLDIRLALINTELALKKPGEALELVHAGLKLNPNESELLKKKEKIQTFATQQNQEKPSPSPATLPTYKSLKALYSSGKQKEAILEAQAYLKQYPKDSDARLALGEFYLSQKQYEAAKTELTLGLTQTPDYLDIRLALIRAELALKKPKEALELVMNGLKRHPGNADLLKKKMALQNLENKRKQTEKTPKEEEGSIFKRLKALFKSGKRSSAIQQAEDYLKRYPKDSDVRLALGGFYLSEKEYLLARQQLTQALLQTPDYLDVRLALINTEMATENYKEALKITQEGLASNMGNSELINKESKLKFIIQEEIKKSWTQDIGLIQQNYYASDQNKVWDYSTLYYSTKTPLGRVSAKLNYSDRNGQRAYQGEFEYFPVINKYLYLDLDYAFARNPYIFPDRIYSAEAFLTIPRVFDVSLGGRYNKVDDIHFFRVYTGSVSKDFPNDRITFRPYYFLPGAGSRSVLNAIDFRHFFDDPSYYVGFTYAAGLSPDLADLETVNFIRLKNNIVGFYWGFPLFNERLSVNLNISCQHQVFPNQNIRNLIGGGASLAFHF